MYIFISLLLILKTIFLQASSPPPEPALADTLPARPGTAAVSAEFVIKTGDHLFSDAYSIVGWLDAAHLVDSFGGEISITDLTSGQRTPMGKASHLKVSPDKQWIAFSTTQDGHHQLWLMQKDGSDKRLLSDLPEAQGGGYSFAYDFSWSPDSTHLALVTNPTSSSENEDELPSTIYAIEITSGAKHAIYSDKSRLQDISWFPDGNKILMSKIKFGFDNDEPHASYIQAVNLTGGQVEVLAKFDGLQQVLQPQLSPDGLSVAFLYNAEDPLFNWMPSIGIVSCLNPEGGQPVIRQLTHEIKWMIAKWAPDGQALYAQRNYGAYNQLYRVDVASGEVTQMTHGPLSITDFWVAPDGQSLVFAGSGVRGEQILRTASSDGSSVRDLCVIPAVDEQLALSEVREIAWDTVDYPSKMRGLLILPKDYQAGKSYPLIVEVHGGGPGAYIYLFGNILTTSPLEWQLWADKGYAVFVPEFRSSAAFGWLAIERDWKERHDLINSDMQDILAGVDELVRQGIADNDRLALIGHSAGGRRANWITVATDRFRTVVSKEGWADDWEAGLQSPQLSTLSFGGTPNEVPENYRKNSALFHAAKGVTPTLFLMGNASLGGADAHHTVNQLYELLKGQGLETDFVYYADEGHNLRLPANRHDAWQRTVEWIDRHLGRSE